MGHGDHLEGDHSLRVPLVIYDPRHKFPAHAVPGIVRDLDLVPTLLRLVDAIPDGGEAAEAPAEQAPGGVKRPPRFDGVSLLPMLRGDQRDLGLDVFSETELWFTRSGPGFGPDERLPYPDITRTTEIDPHDDISVAERYRDLITVAKHRSLRTARYKIIYRPTRSGPHYSLYDVQEDPRELHDLSTERPAELAKMQAELFKRLAQDPTVTFEHGFVLPR